MKGIYREGFFKVSRRLLESSLWCEDGDTLKVFLVLIALSQDPAGPRNGMVFIAKRQLAAKCFLTEDRLERCLEILSQPDAQSRTQSRAGRRIEVVSNGFRVLNYGLYHDQAKDLLLSAARSAAGRVGGRRRAERAKSQSVSSKQKASKAEANPSYGDGDGDGDKKQRTTDSVAIAPASWSAQACDLWISRFGGTAPGGRIGKALKPLVDVHGWPEVQKAWWSYLAQTEAEYASPQRFASTYGRWSGDSPDSKTQDLTEKNRQVIEEWSQKFMEKKE